MKPRPQTKIRDWLIGNPPLIPLALLIQHFEPWIADAYRYLNQTDNPVDWTMVRDLSQNRYNGKSFHFPTVTIKSSHCPVTN